MAFFRVSLALAALASLIAFATAKVKCNGMLNSPAVIYSDVEVEGGNCIIQGIKITGSVTVTKMGSLTTMGKTTILGCLHGFKSNSLMLGGHLTVVGGLSVMDSASAVVVGMDASVGTVSLTSVNNFMAQGNMSSLSVAESGTIHLKGAHVLGGWNHSSRRRGKYQDMWVPTSRAASVSAR